MTDSRSYRGRPVEDRRRERRRRFLDSGLELFGTGGYAGTSVTAICKHAGYSSRQFYEVFTDREHLLREIYDELQELSMAAVASAVEETLGAVADGSTTLVDGIEALTHAFVACYAGSPTRTRVGFIEVVGVSLEFEEHRRAVRSRWSELLASASEIGKARGFAVPATDPLLWSGYIGAVNAVLVEVAETPGADMRDALAVIRRLLRPGVLG